MKNKRSITILTAALTAAALILSACGGSSSSAASTEAAQPANRLEKILAEGKITNVCEPYFAPYEFIDNEKEGQDQFRGADMEFARYIAKELGVELEIVPLEWSAVLTGVTEGKYDMAVAGLGYSEERAKNMELSDITSRDPNRASWSVPRIWTGTRRWRISRERRSASRAAPCRNSLPPLSFRIRNW